MSTERKALLAAGALILLLGVLLFWSRATARNARVDAAVADAIRTEALDTAAAIRARFDELARADSAARVAEADSIAAYRARSEAAEATAVAARASARTISATLRETLSAAQAAALDSINGEHAVEVAAIRTQRDDARAEAALERAAKERALALLFASEEGSRALRRAIDQYEISLAARDGIIGALGREKLVWQGVAVAGVAASLGQAFGLIGG